MRWSEILRNSEIPSFHGSRLTSESGLASAYGMGHRGRALFAGINCDEEHGISNLVQRPDVLALGCSVTASQNLPRRYSWPDMIRRFEGLVVNSLAGTASSAIRQVGAAQISLRVHGAPKEVLALLPNLDRAWLPYLKIEGESAELSFLDALYMPDEARYLVIGEHRAERSPKSLHPLRATDPSQTLAYTHQILDLFALLCEALEIDFRISSWHGPTNGVLADHFPSHIGPDYPVDENADWRIDGAWGDPSAIDCGHEPQNEEQARYWIRADDDLHPGLHHHVHFYETLRGRTVTNDQIALL
jgi:hypothetical protein